MMAIVRGRSIPTRWSKCPLSQLGCVMIGNIPRGVLAVRSRERDKKAISQFVAIN